MRNIIRFLGQRSKNTDEMTCLKWFTELLGSQKMKRGQVNVRGETAGRSEVKSRTLGQGELYV